MKRLISTEGVFIRMDSVQEMRPAPKAFLSCFHLVICYRPDSACSGRRASLGHGEDSAADGDHEFSAAAGSGSVQRNYGRFKRRAVCSSSLLPLAVSRDQQRKRSCSPTSLLAVGFQLRLPAPRCSVDVLLFDTHETQRLH